MLSLAPIRRIVKDYFTVCDSYYAAIRTATPDRIEALDMGAARAARRGLPHRHGAAQAQGRSRFRYGASPVHPDHGVALEGVTIRGAGRPAGGLLVVLFACGFNAVRLPMAAGVFTQIFGRSIYVGSAGVRKGDSIRSRSQSWVRSASTFHGTSPLPSRSWRRGRTQFRSDRYAYAAGASSRA